MRGLKARAVLLFAGILSCIDASAAIAASLRARVEVPGENVRLSDLFAGLQVGQDCDIGPAPAPGKRITVPPAQLAAIASEFAVDWMPGSGYQSVTIDRPARLVTQSEILSVLKPALLADGMPQDSNIALSAFVSPMLSKQQNGAPEIQSLDYEPHTGRFSASLLFAAADTDPVSLRVVGIAAEQTNMLALTHTLPAGTVLAASDLHVIRVSRNMAHDNSLTDADEVVGLSLRRTVAEDVPLLREMLARPIMVERGRPVVLKLEGAGLNLTAAGTALESGASGDRIRVVNPLSRAVLVGLIIGSGQVQIDPGTTPVIMPGGSLQSGLPQLASDSPGLQPVPRTALQQELRP